MNADLTLSHLRTLIDTAARKSGRTVEKVVAVCPYTIRARCEAISSDFVASLHQRQWVQLLSDPTVGVIWLDLTDPGTAHMLVPLLALCHGLDPGPGGRWVAWRPLYASGPVGLRRVGWWLSGDNEAVYYVATADTTGDEDEVVNDAIAAEPDDLAALVAACKLVINTNP